MDYFRYFPVLDDGPCLGRGVRSKWQSPQEGGYCLSKEVCRHPRTVCPDFQLFVDTLIISPTSISKKGADAFYTGTIAENIISSKLLPNLRTRRAEAGLPD